MSDNTLTTPAHGKIALVTGAGSGIGRAVALELAADGYRLALAGRRVEPLEALVQELRAQGRDALWPSPPMYATRPVSTPCSPGWKRSMAAST